MSTALPSTAGTPQPSGLHSQVPASPAQAFAQAQLQQQQIQAQNIFRQKQLMAQKHQQQQMQQMQQQQQQDDSMDTSGFNNISDEWIDSHNSDLDEFMGYKDDQTSNSSNNNGALLPHQDSADRKDKWKRRVSFLY